MENSMSNTFYAAMSTSDVDEAIRLYTKEIEENDPSNFAAWNNRGQNKVAKGEKTKSVDLILDGIVDIKKAIELANEKDLHGYPIAYANLDWAKDILKSITQDCSNRIQ